MLGRRKRDVVRFSPPIHAPGPKRLSLREQLNKVNASANGKSDSLL
jgi:hypothetical protein